MKLPHKHSSPLIIGYLLLCTACHTNDQPLEKELTVGLDNSNQFAEGMLRLLFNEIENKDSDPHGHWQTQVWQSRIKAIHKLSKEFYDYIDSIKSRPELQTRQSLDTLMDKVEHYRRAIPNIFLNDSFSSPNIREDFEKDVKKFNVELPFAATARIGAVSTTASPAVCNKIKNDILLSEYYLINYLYKHIAVYTDAYTIYEPLIHQNYSRLKIGQRLTITAGIGAYSSATKKVTIDGRRFYLNAEGYTQYSIMAQGTPGKHSIPIKIEYIRPDMTPDSFTQNIEYEVTP